MAKRRDIRRRPDRYDEFWEEEEDDDLDPHEYSKKHANKDTTRDRISDRPKKK